MIFDVSQRVGVALGDSWISPEDFVASISWDLLQ